MLLNYYGNKTPMKATRHQQAAAPIGTLASYLRGQGRQIQQKIEQLGGAALL
jgi:hypothetical protein